MKKILIVEDDPSIATALGIRFKSCSYEVTIAHNAMAGVNLTLKQQPHLILLDISMPSGSGFTVAERLQKVLPVMTPFIFLTASKQPGLRAKAEELGAAGFFEKPYEAEELLGAVRCALGEDPAGGVAVAE